MRQFHGCTLISVFKRLAAGCAIATAVACTPSDALAQVLVPGTGQRLTNVGDNFEEEKWDYVYNLPKSSEENDKRQRLPGGFSKNSRWFEGAMRGQPDQVSRVPTPPDGLPGSNGAMMMRSKQTGVPGYYTGKFEQDDFICNVSSRLGGGIPIWRQPSVVVRVHIPPFEHWERRNGPSFGFRTACQTHKTESKRGKFGAVSRSVKPETYWPGFFIHFVPGDGKDKKDHAFFTVRAGTYGQDLHGPKITESGWWTLGMSFTRDGRVHYFAHEGIEPLRAADHISTQYPYSYNCERMDTLFFNVVSGNNGQWSTPWIVDDAELYVTR